VVRGALPLFPLYGGMVKIFDLTAHHPAGRLCIPVGGKAPNFVVREPVLHKGGPREGSHLEGLASFGQNTKCFNSGRGLNTRGI